MKIGEYVKEYTAGKPITFLNVVAEVNELIAEVVKLNRSGIKEEFGDVFHFLQLWLHWRFGVDGKIWNVTKSSVKKFMDRKLIWNEIYAHVGLPENISGYVGNYKKVEKVVRHLRGFGISGEKAEKAYKKVVLGK